MGNLFQSAGHLIIYPSANLNIDCMLLQLESNDMVIYLITFLLLLRDILVGVDASFLLMKWQCTSEDVGA